MKNSFILKSCIQAPDYYSSYHLSSKSYKIKTNWDKFVDKVKSISAGLNIFCENVVAQTIRQILSYCHFMFIRQCIVQSHDVYHYISTIRVISYEFEKGIIYCTTLIFIILVFHISLNQIPLNMQQFEAIPRMLQTDGKTSLFN